MGIKGLLQFLKDQQKIVNLRSYRGCTAAVDVYCWLHKAVYGCVEQIAIAGNDQGQYIKYCEKYWNTLINAGIKPILVFDGQNLPMKAHTEKERRERRKANRDRANALLAEGKRAEARQYFERCIDITPQMAHKVIVAAVSQGIDCIVAPYEADAQLAYLSISGIAQLIISEDSDLLCFGCERVIFKLDLNGNGVMQERTAVLEHKSFRKKFTLDHFTKMCILSGCDYIPSLPGIGLAKACKFMSQNNNSQDVAAMLRRLPLSIKLPSGAITDEYIQNFVNALMTFNHQVVYDPRTRKRMPMTPCTDTCCGSEHPEDMSFSGRYFPAQKATQMALGNINLHNMETLLPEIDPNLLLSRENGKQSMWHPQYKPKGQWNTEDFRSIDRSQASSTKDKSVLIPTNRIVRKRTISQSETEAIVSSLCNEDVSAPSQTQSSTSNNTQSYPGDGFSSVKITAKSNSANNGNTKKSYSVPEPDEADEDPVNQVLDDLDQLLGTSPPLRTQSSNSSLSVDKPSSAPTSTASHKFMKDKMRQIYHSQDDDVASVGPSTPIPQTKSRYFGSTSSTPSQSSSYSQRKSSALCSQYDEGKGASPNPITSPSSVGYKAKFLGALDELESMSSPQSQAFRWSKSSLHQHIKDEGGNSNTTLSPQSSQSSTAANHQFKSPLLKSRIVNATMKNHQDEIDRDTDLKSSPPTVSKRINPFKQTSRSTSAFDRLGVDKAPTNPFKRTSNPDLLCKEDSVLGRAVPELQTKKTNRVDDIFSLKSLARIGTKPKTMSVTQRLNVFKVKRSPSKVKKEATPNSEPTGDTIDLSDDDMKADNETTPKHHLAKGSDNDSESDCNSLKRSSSKHKSIADVLATVPKKKRAGLKQTTASSNSKRSRTSQKVPSAHTCGDEIVVEVGSDTESDTSEDEERISKKHKQQKKPACETSVSKARQIGLSKRVSSFSSIMRSGAGGAPSPSPALPEPPGALYKSLTAEELGKVDNQTEAEQIEIHKDVDLETPKATKEKENKPSIKDFLAKFSRKSDQSKAKRPQRRPLNTSPTNSDLATVVDLT